MSSEKRVQHVIAILIGILAGICFYRGQRWPEEAFETRRLFVKIISIALVIVIPILLNITPFFGKQLEKIIGKCKELSKKQKKMILLWVAVFTITAVIFLMIGRIWRHISQDSYNVYLLVFSATIIILIEIVLCLKINKVKSIAIWFALITLTIGTLEIYVTPYTPGVSFDDQIHYQRTLEVSNIMTGVISTADIRMIEEHSFAGNVIPITQDEKNDYYTKIQDIMNQGEYVGIDTNYISNHAGYLPFAIGITLGRAISHNYIVAYCLGKWFNLLLYVLVIAVAVHLLGEKGVFLAALSMAPGVLFLAVNYGYDTWLYMWVALGYAIYFWMTENNKVYLKGIILSVVFVGIGCLVKQVYFPLMFPMFCTGIAALDTNKKKWISSLVTVLLICVLIASYVLPTMSNTATLSDTRGTGNINGIEQMKFMLSNIPSTLKLFLSFILYFINPNTSASTLLESHAYLGEGNLGYLIFAILLALMLIVGLDKKNAHGIGKKISVFIGELGTLLMVVAALYITYNEVGANWIVGVQSRYLLPLILPLMIYVPYGESSVDRNSGVRKISMIALGILAYAELYAIWQLMIIVF